MSSTIWSRLSASWTCHGSNPSFQFSPKMSVSSADELLDEDELLLDDEDEELDELLLSDELDVSSISLDEVDAEVEDEDEELLDEELSSSAIAS